MGCSWSSNSLEEPQDKSNPNLLVLFPSGSSLRTKQPNPTSIISKFAKETAGTLTKEKNKLGITGTYENRHFLMLLF